ncbi:hypothetical protein QCA50_003930 [Cerrena zonata]|uniref:NAD-dependent epimerase/dehydratase domain-containing protein n=1 Tax=Cerrena zonata TaxID=2478898 RepID=A0AAW0GST9_9APHY
MSSKFVLVTGGTGFMGGHIVHQLLAGGQRVRAIVRSGKGDQLKETYAQYGDKLDTAVVDDFVSGDFTHTFKDVDAVIHAAAPMPTHIKSAEDALKTAIDGTLNIFKQAEKAGIRNFAYTSSVVALNLEDPAPITDQSWNPITKDIALQSKEPFVIYIAEKTLAEKAVWEFVDKHPHVEMMTVNPPFFYGPYAPSYRNDDASKGSLSTNGFIYSLLTPNGTGAPGPYAIDVRDVAKALILGLKAPPTSQVGRKRIILSSACISAKDVVELIASERPELKGRLSKAAFDAPPAPKSALDLSRAKEVLGLEFRDWKETILAAVDDLIKFEGIWKAKGVTFA